MSYLCYLTPAEKRQYMHGLAEALRENNVDAEMVPWLSLLNELPGVCTTQCCAGHPERDLSWGYISLRMTGRLHRLFEAHQLGNLWLKGWMRDAETCYNLLDAGYIAPRIVLWFDAALRDEALADILAVMKALSEKYTGRAWKEA